MGIFKNVVLDNKLLFCFVFFGYACFERKEENEGEKKERKEESKEQKERGN